MQELEQQQNEQEPSSNEEKKKTKKPFFTAKKIATLGVFTALSFCVQFLEFPIFAATPWLELDFSYVFVMLAGFLFGPVEGVIVCVLKELLHIPIGKTGGVGELANILIGISFLSFPAILYRFKKGLKVVIPSLLAAVIIAAACSLPVNRFINYPFYVKDMAVAIKMFQSTWQFVLAFNAIKWASISVLCCVLYKTLSKFLKKFLK